MPRVKRERDAVLKLSCDDPSDTFTVRYTNMGEPFREGVEIGITNDEFDKDVTVMLEESEAKQLRDTMNRQYPLLVDRESVASQILKLAEQDIEAALQVVTSMTIGLNEQFLKLNNEDVTKEITIETGYRAITIHKAE